MSFCLVSPGVAGIATNIAICCSTGVPSHLARKPYRAGHLRAHSGPFLGQARPVYVAPLGRVKAFSEGSFDQGGNIGSGGRNGGGRGGGGGGGRGRGRDRRRDNDWGTPRESPAFKAYALTVALLAVKQLILQVVYQFSRIVTGNHSNEEDVTQWDGFLGLDARIGNSDITSRASKCMQSELKSTPYFMGIGFLYLLDAGKKANPAFMYTYLVARVCHSISYMAGWSLPRTGCLLVGLGSELAMTSFVLKAVFFS